MSESKGHRRRRRRRRNKKKNNPNAKERGRALCWHFNSPHGCRFGDKCKFLHEEKVKPGMDKTWWRQGPEPVKKPLYNPAKGYDLQDIVQASQINGAFVGQLIQCLSAPKRIRQQIHNEPALIATLIRSFVPKLEVNRSVSLFPLLGKIHQFSLNAMAVCPVTSKLYCAGSNIPVFSVDINDPESEAQLSWLIGSSWPENGVLETGQHSPLVRSVHVTSSGRVLWVVDIEGEEAVGGAFSCMPGESLQKLSFVDLKAKKVELVHLRSICTSDTGDELWILTKDCFYRVEFNEEMLSEHLQVKDIIFFPEMSGQATIVPIDGTDSIALACPDKVILLTPGGLQQTCSLNLQILSYCPMPRNDGAILLHSPECIRIVEKKSFAESIRDGKLRERIWERSHKLFSKGIVMDLPLLAYDSRRQQIVTDTDARVFTWLDIY